MRYFVLTRDEAHRPRQAGRIEEAGYDVAEEYDEDAVIVTFGGDGTILYAARNFASPTILPVRTGTSIGEKTQLEEDELEAALERLETGIEGEDYRIERHRKIAAYADGDELGGSFSALNDINLHHRSPVTTVVFDLHLRDAGLEATYERVIGDGVVVATPFGSTGYYRSITGGSIAAGLGVALNNVHSPRNAPDYAVLSAEGVVELEVRPKSKASTGLLTRDDDPSAHELHSGEPVEIRRTDEAIELIAIDDP